MISKGLLDKYGKVNDKTPADYAKTIVDVRCAVIRYNTVHVLLLRLTRRGDGHNMGRC